MRDKCWNIRLRDGFVRVYAREEPTGKSLEALQAIVDAGCKMLQASNVEKLPIQIKPICPKCGDEGEPSHRCVYDDELGIDGDTCNCCRACQEECYRDV